LSYICGVQGSNFTNGICCGQGWNVDQIFFTYIDYLPRGKNIVKGATKMSGPSLKLFICLKYHKWSIIVYIVIIFWEYFSIIAKFTCSKFDTNKKCFCMFKSFKPQKWIVSVFFKCVFFYQMCTILFEKWKEFLNQW